jgi:hypothetical protein
MCRKIDSQIDYYFSIDDAGSAYHVAAFIKQKYHKIIHERNCVFKLGLPAKKVFSEILSKNELLSLKLVEQMPYSTKTAIIGTGDGFECSELHSAVNSSARVFAIFDNWTDFDKRLSFKGNKLKVRGIIVTDKQARKLAEDLYPNISVRLFNNQIILYLKSLKKDKLSVQKNLLLIHQPFSENLVQLRSKKENLQNILRILQTEIRIFEKSIEKTVDLSKIENKIVRIHPIIYTKFSNIKNQELTGYKISHNTLAEDLNKAGVVVGYDSYALYLAEKLNIKTIRLSNSD